MNEPDLGEDFCLSLQQAILVTLFSQTDFFSEKVAIIAENFHPSQSCNDKNN
jgi:hypothetical protein